MAVIKIDIEEFLLRSADSLVLDVRSPSEYTQAHFPGAQSLPLFSDEQRKVIGTLYKQQGREFAIKKGLDFFGPEMKSMVVLVEKMAKDFKKSIKPKDSTQKILVHCWRGGMRSAAVAWLLDLYGYEVYQLEGGYKVFRHWVLERFEKNYSFRVLGGYTGSGKTILLKELQRSGQTVIDLEGLANHKGSAFGALGEQPQPRQEMFENLLAINLWKVFDNNDKGIAEYCWVEDESQRIGPLNIPVNIWMQMRNCPVYFLDISFEQRLDHIVEHYGKFDIQQLADSILRIKKRLGGLEAGNAIRYLIENDKRECFRILLEYYDKLYAKGLANRENLNELLIKIPSASVDAEQNSLKILNTLPVVSG